MKMEAVCIEVNYKSTRRYNREAQHLHTEWVQSPSAVTLQHICFSLYSPRIVLSVATLKHFLPR
jgi:hypothetical protein